MSNNSEESSKVARSWKSLFKRGSVKEDNQTAPLPLDISSIRMAPLTFVPGSSTHHPLRQPYSLSPRGRSLASLPEPQPDLAEMTAAECLRLGVSLCDERGMLEISTFLRTPLPTGWVEAVTDSTHPEGPGIPFFYNNKSGVSQWERPGESELVGRLLELGMPEPDSLLWKVLLLSRSVMDKALKPALPIGKARDFGWLPRPVLSNPLRPEDLDSLAKYFNIPSSTISECSALLKIAALSPLPEGWISEKFPGPSGETTISYCQTTLNVRTTRHPIDAFFSRLFDRLKFPDHPSPGMTRFRGFGWWHWIEKRELDENERSGYFTLIRVGKLFLEISKTVEKSGIFLPTDAALNGVSKGPEGLPAILAALHIFSKFFGQEIKIEGSNWIETAKIVEKKLLEFSNRSGLERLSGIPKTLTITKSLIADDELLRDSDSETEEVSDTTAPSFFEFDEVYEALIPGCYLFRPESLKQLCKSELKHLCKFLIDLNHVANKQLIQALMIRDQVRADRNAQIAIINKLRNNSNN